MTPSAAMTEQQKWIAKQSAKRRADEIVTTAHKMHFPVHTQYVTFLDEAREDHAEFSARELVVDNIKQALFHAYVANYLHELIKEN